MTVFTKEFWLAAAERATKTAGQAGLLSIGADQLNILTLDWATLAGFMGGGAVLSVLTSLASAKVGGPGPSVAGETLAQTATVTVPADGTPRTVEFDGMGAPISNPEGQ